VLKASNDTTESIAAFQDRCVQTVNDNNARVNHSVSSETDDSLASPAQQGRVYFIDSRTRLDDDAATVTSNLEELSLYAQSGRAQEGLEDDHSHEHQHVHGRDYDSHDDNNAPLPAGVRDIFTTLQIPDDDIGDEDEEDDDEYGQVYSHGYGLHHHRTDQASAALHG